MGWKDLIPQCFGVEDAKFALHGSDEEVARKAIDDAKYNRVSRNDFEKEAKNYLQGRVSDAGVRAECEKILREGLDRLW